MKTMYEYAREYGHTHQNGYVTKVNDYSFEFTLYPKKKDETKIKSYVVMSSYFWKPKAELA